MRPWLVFFEKSEPRFPDKPYRAIEIYGYILATRASSPLDALKRVVMGGAPEADQSSRAFVFPLDEGVVFNKPEDWSEAEIVIPGVNVRFTHD